MKVVNIRIGKLFEALQAYENVKFSVNAEYYQHTKMSIKDENDEWTPIQALIIKKDDISKISFHSGLQIKVGSHHKICVNKITKECKFAYELNVGDKIDTVNSTQIVSENEKIGYDNVYDMQVAAPSHLYSTPDGIIHHNTLVACQVALDLLFKKEVQKIIITRPTVSKEEIGFLPGDLREKMDPWMQPVYSNFYLLYNKEKIDEIIESNRVEIVPVAFMRGRTFLDSFVIVDEAQNCTNDQMEMIVSRLGIRSKMVVCGDTQQVDLKNRSESGFKFLLSAANKIKDMESMTLTTNHRHPVVDALLDSYAEMKEIKEKNFKN